MNAVDPVRRMRPLSAESRIIRRGVLGDRVDGRGREGRFLSQIGRELTRAGRPAFVRADVADQASGAGSVALGIDRRAVAGWAVGRPRCQEFFRALKSGSASCARTWAEGRAVREAA